MMGVPPWLNVTPDSFVRSANEGASAGLGAARLRQAGDSDAARLALEAQSIAQRADAADAQLSEHERIAQMEAQTRKEIAQQNQLRETQQLAIEQAYKQAQLGLGKQRIDEQKAIANAKAKEAAMTYQQEQGAAQYLRDNPGDVAGALLNFPKGRSVVGTIGRSQSMDGVQMQDVDGHTFAKISPNRFELMKDKVDPVTVIKLKNLSDDRKQALADLKAAGDDTEKMQAKLALQSIEKKQIELATGKSRKSGNTAVTPPGTRTATAPPQQSPFKEGQKIRNIKDGKEYIVKDGQPVPVEDQTDEP
jgi:hypothetical protein